jgi:hypothetical protein
MKLSELIARHGLVGVHEKTTISIEILDKLESGKFEEMGRVRSLGFVSILKREYDIELDELESSIKAYFEEHTVEDDEPVLVAIDRTESSSGYIKWFLVFALLAGLWYLYDSNKLSGNLSNVENKEAQLNENEILENNVRENDDHEIMVVTTDKNKTKKLEVKTAQNSPTLEDEALMKSELNKTLHQELNQTVTFNDTKNKENKKIIDNLKKSDDIKKENTFIKEDIVENIVDENSIEAVDEISPSKIEVVDTTVDEDEIAKIIYNVTVNPRVNLWFGFINLDSKGRKEFMTTESTSIDVGEQRWILMTGHGRLSVASDSEILEVNDRRKHYFYIDSNEIREITRKEFRKFNNGRGW